MIALLFQSLRKSWRLKNISKKLSKSGDTKIKNNSLNELLILCKADENVSYVINEYKVNDALLKSLFEKLIRSGAGQYASGHYVAASSLCYAWTLKFLLDHFDGKDFYIKNYDSYNSSLFIANRLVNYFNKGEAGEIIS